MNKANSLEHLFPMHLLMNRKSKFNTAIDVGVNSLRYLEFYSQYFDNVVGLEANPITYNKMINCLPPNVELYNVCASNQNRTVSFYSCLADSGYSTMSNDRYDDLINDGTFGADQFEIFELETRILDNMLSDYSAIDLIKIDAEYEDINIFLGLKKTIQKNRPVIQMEHVNDSNQSSEFYEELNSINYVEITPHFESRNHFFVPMEDIKNE